MSSWRRLPNGSQISEGLNRNRSEEDTTVTSTSPWSSCLTLSAAVRPPKLPPRTSTFLRNDRRDRWPCPRTDLLAVDHPRRAAWPERDESWGPGIFTRLDPS